MGSLSIYVDCENRWYGGLLEERVLKPRARQKIFAVCRARGNLLGYTKGGINTLPC